MINTLVFISWSVAALSLALFLCNLLFYRRLPPAAFLFQASQNRNGRSAEIEGNKECLSLASAPRSSGPERGEPAVSVLIPARDEEANIEAAVKAVLANRGVAVEVVVVDDHSTDRTPAVLETLSREDARVRWEMAPTLPEGWCGKQHACQELARLARHEWIVFVDADVRLAPDALARMVTFMQRSGADLASGVPRQITGAFLERLLLPLIHFVLLGYLPMPFMRWTKRPAFSAGCGQLFVARRSAYARTGGHAAIRASLHDGLTLPRAFRKAGFRTDLFDATDVASCRMYHGNGATWRGLQKNATEGLAAPRTFGPMAFLLVTGQVLPFLLLGALPWVTESIRLMIVAAVLGAWLPRFIGAWKFRQSWLGAALHPVGVATLLLNQWLARRRVARGQPMIWRNRSYGPRPGPANTAASTGPQSKTAALRSPTRAVVSLLLLSPLGLSWAVLDEASLARADKTEHAAGQAMMISSFQLEDQFGHRHDLQFPRTNAVVLAIADREGAEQLAPWIDALRRFNPRRVEVHGLAPVGDAPAFIRKRLIRKFREEWSRAVMLDWGATLSTKLRYHEEEANILVIDADGTVDARFHGAADEHKLRRLRQTLQRLESAASGVERRS